MVAKATLRRKVAPVTKRRVNSTRVNGTSHSLPSRRLSMLVPAITSMPDLHVNERAATLIKCAVLLAKVEREIRHATRDIPLRGTSAEGFIDGLGGLAFDFWVSALDQIQEFHEVVAARGAAKGKGAGHAR